MKRTLGILMLSAALCNARADTLNLRNGPSMDGEFINAIAGQVRFRGADGLIKAYPISNIESLEFSMPRPGAVRAGARIVIPAGTMINVRTIDNIDSTQTAAGARYRASVDDPVVVGNQVIIPRGANCTVQIDQVQANKEIAIKLFNVTVGGRTYDTAASYAQLDAQGTSKTRKGVKRGALLGGLGAAIGGIAGGGSGAAIGAVSGAGLGAISGAAAHGKTLKIPPETRLTFQLQAALPLS